VNVTIVALVARVSTGPLSFGPPTEVDVGLMQYVIKATSVRRTAARGIDLHGGAQIFSASNASLSAFNVRFPDVELVAYDTRLDGV
jgi:hypothetical protein